MGRSRPGALFMFNDIMTREVNRAVVDINGEVERALKDFGVTPENAHEFEVIFFPAKSRAFDNGKGIVIETIQDFKIRRNPHPLSAWSDYEI